MNHYYQIQYKEKVDKRAKKNRIWFSAYGNGGNKLIFNSARRALDKFNEMTTSEIFEFRIVIIDANGTFKRVLNFGFF